ncbi:hypothetical protein KCU67_g15058, partial [Aureobasidium melanogenum]
TARLAEVGFVERKEGGGAIVDGKLSCGGPLRQKIRIVVVEQRDKFQCWVKATTLYTSSAAWCKEPVVGPRNLAILPAEGKRHGVGVAGTAKLVLGDEVATEEEGELELIRELDELGLERIKDDDDDDDDDDDEGVGLAVDMTELVDVVDTALVELDEVEDGDVGETIGLKLLDAIVDEMLEIGELPRLELDEGAAFGLLEDDELALLSVSKFIFYGEYQDIHTCLWQRSCLKE